MNALKTISIIHTLIFLGLVYITNIPNTYFQIFSEQAIAGSFSISGAVLSILFLRLKSFNTIKKIIWILISLIPFLTLVYWTQIEFRIT